MDSMEQIWSKSYDEGVKRSLQVPHLSLYDMLRITVSRFPQQKATLYFGTSLTYTQLLERVHRMAAALSSMGIKKGDRVAVMLPNCPQYLISFFAIARLGAICVQVSPLFQSDELLFELVDSQSEHLIILDLFYPVLQKIEKKSPVKRVIFTSASEYFPFHLKILYPIKLKKEGKQIKIPKREEYLYFQDLLKNKSTLPQVEIDPQNDIALFQYTGGTTGSPKGAQLTHTNVVINAYQTKEWLGSQCNEGHEIILDVLPLYHSYGMTTAMNISVLIGGTLILIPRFDLEQILKAIEKFKPTLFPGVPTLYVAIINHPKIKEYNLSSIKACISGAAPLPVEVKRKFEELTGGLLVEGYGLSEASPVTHCNPIEKRGKIGSIGIPMSNTVAKIVDLETGEDLPPNEKGELVISGPQVMKGYWKREEETDIALRDGWLHTGDIAIMDEEGFFFIVDRKKDMIISGGFNIYPRDVEEVLYKHPSVLEAVVVGLPDDYHGEIVKAYIVLKPNVETTAEEIRQFCKEKIAKYKVPREIEFRQDLPKSMVGKVLRRELREEEIKKRAQGEN